MNNEEIGRMGVACIIAVLCSLVEAQLELCSAGMPRNAIFWWLLMIIGSGFVLDATKGSSKKILLFSSAIVATAFFVWVVTLLSIFLLSFSNPVLKNIVSNAAKNKTALQIENIEKTIRSALTVIAVLILVLQLK